MSTPIIGETEEPSGDVSILVNTPCHSKR